MGLERLFAHKEAHGNADQPASELSGDIGREEDAHLGGSARGGASDQTAGVFEADGMGAFLGVELALFGAAVEAHDRERDGDDVLAQEALVAGDGAGALALHETIFKHLKGGEERPTTRLHLALPLGIMEGNVGDCAPRCQSLRPRHQRRASPLQDLGACRRTLYGKDRALVGSRVAGLLDPLERDGDGVSANLPALRAGARALHLRRQRAVELEADNEARRPEAQRAGKNVLPRLDAPHRTGGDKLAPLLQNVRRSPA